MKDQQPCQVCDRGVPANARYPRAVCSECTARARDAAGLPVAYFNVTIHGTGLIERVLRDGSWTTARETVGYGPFECWIDGIVCEAAEAYFGGVVIQPRLSK